VKIRRVRKRDGREVPFELEKIQGAVARAQTAVREDDPLFAHEVAQIVELALERRHSSRGAESVPDIEEIQDLVEKALVELGRAAVAKAYILYRDRRARIRAALEVRGPMPRAAARAQPARPPHAEDRSLEAHAPVDRALAERSPSDTATESDEHDEVSEARSAPIAAWTRAPRVQFSEGVASWSKGRIVAALMNEADLPRASAERVAARVEERVFDSGFRQISTSLIRELVDNELVELGLDQALRKQRVFGLARHDLRALIADPAHAGADDGDESLASGAARSAERAIASDVLRRYALEDALPAAAAELHLAGELSIESLERPHLALTRALPCDLVMSGEPGPSAAFRLLDELADASLACAHGIVLDDCGALLQSLQRGRAAGQGWLSQWLRSLAAIARTSGRHIDLCASDPSQKVRGLERTHASAWIARVIEELDAIACEAGSSAPPRLFVEIGELALAARESTRLAAPLERLILRGCVVPTFASASEIAVGPGLVRHARERGVLTCGGAIALNLPRLARRAGPWREDAMLEELSAIVPHALTALAALEELQRADRGVQRGRVTYALAPVGVREALRCLSDGELRPEPAVRLFAFLTEAAQRFGQARGLSVTITPSFGEAAALRFAALDAEIFSAHQPMLFDLGPSHGAPGRAAYSCGYDLTNAAGGESSSTLAATAALLSTQRCGTIQPAALLSALKRARGGDEFSVLSVLERLELARARLRNGSPPLYALPRALSSTTEPDDRGSRELFPEPAAIDPSSPPNLSHVSGRQRS
jgi:hypothetical protein